MGTLLQTLGIDLPIIQAPMAGVSTPAMAAAVSNAGGLGSIGVGPVDAEATRQMIAAVRAATDRPFNVNVFCNRPAVADAAREAAWLARLAPDFRRFGAEPPARLTEIYQSFVDDDAMLAVLLDERPSGRQLPLRPARRPSGSRPCAPPGSCCSPRPRIWTRRGRSPPPGSMPSSRKATRRADIAACSTPTRRDDRLGTMALTRLARARARDPGDRGRRDHGRGRDRRLPRPRRGRRPTRHGLHRLSGVVGRRGLSGRAAGRRLRAHRDDDGDLRPPRPLPRQPLHGPRR